MDKLKQEIKSIKNTLNTLKPGLVMCHTHIKDVEKTQEYIENRLSVNENLGERITRLEEYIDVVYKHLNITITRVNTITTYLKEMEISDDELFEEEENLKEMENSDDELFEQEEKQ